VLRRAKCGGRLPCSLQPPSRPPTGRGLPRQLQEYRQSGVFVFESQVPVPDDWCFRRTARSSKAVSAEEKIRALKREAFKQQVTEMRQVQGLRL